MAKERVSVKQYIDENLHSEAADCKIGKLNITINYLLFPDRFDFEGKAKLLTERVYHAIQNLGMNGRKISINFFCNYNIPSQLEAYHIGNCIYLGKEESNSVFKERELERVLKDYLKCR